MKLDALLRDHPNVQSVTLDAHDNVSSFSLAGVATTDEAVRRALGAHVRQEDTASGAVEPSLAQGGDLTKQISRVLGSLLFGTLSRSSAESWLVNLFNEHVDLNRRAIHPGVERIMAAVDKQDGCLKVRGYGMAGRTFDLAGQPMAFTDGELSLPMVQA